MPVPVELLVAHTSQLDPSVLAAARRLLDQVFVDDPLTPDDWEHALGGVHAVLLEGDQIIAHASVVQRRLIHTGVALRTGYVEGVGVRPDRQRLGHGGTVMAALEQVVRGAYDLGALAATETAVPFYAARGWQAWHGTAWALTPDGVRRTPDVDDCLFVLPGSAVAGSIDVRGSLTCDWRDGEVW